MKTKTSLSQGQNTITTINLLRERAAEFLSVAANLEATQKFVGNGITPMIHARSPGKRHMSIAVRRKIAKAAKARAAQKKLAVVGKAA
jgi:hypothetical protein